MEKPWLNEPNRVEFKYKGYDCLIQRVGRFHDEFADDYLGHLCGYVALPKSHPYYGKNYDDIPIEVHGGLTYARACQGKICHVPSEGESDDVWWVGFDCAHAGDLIPGIQKMREPVGLFYDIDQKYAYLNLPEDVYRDIEFVRNEIEDMVDQLELVK